MGMRPIAEIMYIDFITIAMDQIVNHAAKWPQLSGGKVTMPIVFRTQGAPAAETPRSIPSLLKIGSSMFRG